MDKAQQKALIKAWNLQLKILDEIHTLAMMNTMLAYGVIRQGETLVDAIAVMDIRKRAQDKLDFDKGVNNGKSV